MERSFGRLNGNNIRAVVCSTCGDIGERICYCFLRGYVLCAGDHCEVLHISWGGPAGERVTHYFLSLRPDRDEALYR